MPAAVTDWPVPSRRIPPLRWLAGAWACHDATVCGVCLGTLQTPGTRAREADEPANSTSHACLRAQHVIHTCVYKGPSSTKSWRRVRRDGCQSDTAPAQGAKLLEETTSREWQEVVCCRGLPRLHPGQASPPGMAPIKWGSNRDGMRIKAICQHKAGVPQNACTPLPSPGCQLARLHESKRLLTDRCSDTPPE